MHKYIIALALALIAGPGWAAGCEQAVKSNDAMQYDVKEIVIPKSCKKFTVKLEHTGKLPKAAMGHNWVLTKDADFQAMTKAGASAGIAKDYVADDVRIVAHTKLLGGGESTAITFDVSKLAAGASYTYFCSFPGHWAMMKGTLKLAK